MAYLDLRGPRSLILIVLFIVIRIHLEIVESELLLDALLESGPLLEGQAVALGNDWHHVDELAQLLQHDDVDWLQGVPGRLNEEQTAMDPGVLQIFLTLCCELLPEICAMLILDVLDNWVPAAIIVDEIAIARCIHDVEAQTHAILFDGMGHSLDLCGCADSLIRRHATLGVCADQHNIWYERSSLPTDKMRSKDRIDQSGLSETGLPYKAVSVW